MLESVLSGSSRGLLPSKGTRARMGARAGMAAPAVCRRSRSEVCAGSLWQSWELRGAVLVLARSRPSSRPRAERALPLRQ